MKTYFFGCARTGTDRQVGHYLYGKNATPLYGRDDTTPWGRTPDGTLAPNSTAAAGVASLHHKDGWTALSFWDYSGDSRGKSNSNFFFEGEYGFDEAVSLMREQYPKIVARFKFPIAKAGTP